MWNFNATDLLHNLIKFIEMLWSYQKCQKIGVGRDLGRANIKNPGQNIWSKWSNSVKLYTKRNVCNLFLCVF